jgi:hypothetical protein
MSFRCYLVIIHVSVCLCIALQRLRAPRVCFEILVLFFVWLFCLLSCFFASSLFCCRAHFLLTWFACLLLFLRTVADSFFGLISFLGLSVVFYCSFCFLLKLCVCLFFYLFVSGGAAKKKLRTDGRFFVGKPEFQVASFYGE